MDRVERKKHTRRQLSKKIRHDRLISQYVHFKYPEVYAEANNYYNQLEAKHPNKRDLCKTLEFIQLTTGAGTYSEFYHHKRQKNKKGETTKKQHTFPDKMVLEIPLIDSNTVTNETLSLNIPEYEELMQEIRNDPDLYAIVNNFTTPGDEITDMSGAQNLEVQHTGESFLGVPNKVYEELIHELNQDPELAKIFEDIEYNEQTLEDIDIEYSEQTPLEKELLELGW